jgi:large subunit ribosomal protein L4
MDIQMRSGDDASVQVSDAVFGAEYRPALIHQVVSAYLAGARAGTKAQKNRSTVSGGGAKPFRQKGTGRARAGTSRSPIWRGGGKVFAAQPRDFRQKVNRKMYRGAVRSILSELSRQERLVIVPGIKVDAPKTKILAELLRALDLKGALILVDDLDENLYLAARNLPNVDIMTAEEADPVSLIAFDSLVVTEGAIRKLEERFS